MNANKPVAWMRLTGNRVTRINLEKVRDDDIPLYTHPAKTELQMEWTDEQKQKLKEFLSEVFGWDKK